MEHPTFITNDELMYYILSYGWSFPLVIIATFLGLYRYSLWKRIKQEIKKRKDLTNLEHRSNGHHKPKEKVHE